MWTKEQKEAIKKLSRLKVGALFMEMGTGKTRVALDLMASKAHKVKQLLWLCPCSLKGEIEQERAKWQPDLALRVIGIETLSASDKTYLEVLESVKERSTFCVVDESLKIKNLGAKRTKRILQIGSYCKYRLILNGTPLSKNVLDLWPQMEFLSHKILDMDFRAFKYNYCEFKKEPGRRERIVKNYNLPHLITKIEPYIFDSKLYLDIPKNYKTYKYYIDLSLYRAFKNKLFLEEAEYTTGGELMDFSWYKIITKLQRYYTSSEEHHKELQNLIKKINEQVVIFVKFISSIPAGALALTGDTKPEYRQGIINKHKNGEQQALYVTYGLGAYGLNLQHCHNVIFAEHSWDYAQRIQAEARIYRMGQTKECNFYDIDCNTGLERLLHDCNNKKEHLADRVKREITNQKKLKDLL